MGGPASPFLWNIGYDLILWAMSRVAMCRCPGYVDDLAALIRGPVQAMRALILLLALSKIAGLSAVSHLLELDCHRPDVPQLLRVLEWNRLFVGE